MAFCLNCGIALPDGSKFCPSCGTPQPDLANIAPAPAAAPVVEPAVEDIFISKRKAPVQETVAAAETVPVEEIVEERVEEAVAVEEPELDEIEIPRQEVPVKVTPAANVPGRLGSPIMQADYDMESGEEPDPVVGNYSTHG